MSLAAGSLFGRRAGAHAAAQRAVARPDALLPAGLAPRLIAVDLDGTLVPPSGTVPPGVPEAVARVSAAGAIVVAATGRSLSTTGSVARAAGMHDWAIVSNGAMVVTVDPESVVEALTFDAATLLTDLAPLLPSACFAVERPDGVFLTTHYFEDPGWRSTCGRSPSRS